jgi:hypothetical protein
MASLSCRSPARAINGHALPNDPPFVASDCNRTRIAGLIAISAAGAAMAIWNGFEPIAFDLHQVP